MLYRPKEAYNRPIITAARATAPTTLLRRAPLTESRTPGGQRLAEGGVEFRQRAFDTRIAHCLEVLQRGT